MVKTGGVEAENKIVPRNDVVENGGVKARRASVVNKANNVMSEALSALRERGEKMREVDDKASELKDNAEEFSSLAKQLRKKMEKKNKAWWLL